MTENTTKSMIQTNMDKLKNKAFNCDPTIVEDVTLVNSMLVHENLSQTYDKHLSDEESREFSDKFREHIDLFKRCSCKKERHKKSWYN